MKKNTIIVLLVLVALVVVFIGVKFIPFGTKEAMMGANITRIEVPSLSSLESECCEYEATFKSFRGKGSIQKELDKMVDKYIKIDCSGKTVYYDMDHNITVFDYEVNGGLIFTTYTIKYNIGQTCE